VDPCSLAKEPPPEGHHRESNAARTLDSYNVSATVGLVSTEGNMGVARRARSVFSIPAGSQAARICSAAATYVEYSSPTMRKVPGVLPAL